MEKPQGFVANWPAPNDPAFERRFFHCWHRYWEYRSDAARAAPPPDAGASRFLWGLAFALDRALTSDRVFDLHVLGAIVRAGALLLVLAFYALAIDSLRGRSWLLPVLVAFPVAASLADPRHTTFFATFYRESATLLLAQLTVCGILACGARPFWVGAAVTTLAGALLAGSATAHFFIAFLAAAALLAAFLRRRRDPVARGSGGPGAVLAPLALAAAVLLLVGAGIQSPRRTPPELRRKAAFNSLFTGALLLSDGPARQLAASGFPAESRRLVGQHAFTPDGSRFVREHPSLLTHGTTFAVLRREPRLAPRLLQRGAEWMAEPEKSLWLASHESCDGRRPRLAWWSAAKGLLPAGHPLLALLAGAAAAGLLALRSPDARVFAVGLGIAFAALCALGELAVAMFGDGFMDLSRHLLAAGFFLDLTLALVLWSGVLAMTADRAP